MSFGAVEMAHLCVHLQICCRFWAFVRRLNVRDRTTDAPVLVFDRSGRPSSPSPPRPPTPTDRVPRRRGAGPSSYCLWQCFLLQRPCERRKIANFLQMDAKNVSFLFHRGTRNPSLEEMERWYFTLRSNFPSAMSRLFGN